MIVTYEVYRSFENELGVRFYPRQLPIGYSHIGRSETRIISGTLQVSPEALTDIERRDFKASRIRQAVVEANKRSLDDQTLERAVKAIELIPRR